MRFYRTLLLSAVLIAALSTSGQASKGWQQFRALGGRTLEGAIRSVVTDSRYIYALSATGGARYDQLLGRWEFSVPPTSPAGGFSFAALDHLTGDIYFVQGNKLIPYGTLAKSYFREIILPSSPLALAFDGRGIWARTNQGVYLCDRWNRKIKAESDSGRPLDWQGQLDLNKVKRDPRFFGLAPYYIMDHWALAHHLIVLRLEPSTSTAWLSFDGLGLWRYDLFTKRLEQFTAGFLASTNVSAIASGTGGILMGGQGGLTAVGADGEQWQQLDKFFNLDLAQYKIRALAVDGRDIFVGTDRGIVTLEAGSRLAGTIGLYEGLPQETINCLFLQSDTLWIGTSRGLFCYLRSAREILNLWPMLSSYGVNGISGDQDFIYLATDRGGIKIDKADSLKPYRYGDESPGEINGELVSVSVQDSLVWWLGRECLMSYHRFSRSWSRHPRDGNYVAGQGQCLSLDPLNVWIGTDNGLVRLNKTRGEFRVYHNSQGLLDEQVWAVCSFNGKLWAGGTNGASCFSWADEAP